MKIRKTLVKLLDFIGVHIFIGQIRFYIPILLKRKRLNKHGLNALIILNNVFEINNSFFWLEFGSLLGAYREKAFIRNDFDIDIGVLAENRISNLQQLIEPLGFIKIRELYISELGVIEETYTFNGAHIDILYFYSENEKKVCYLYVAREGEYWREVMYTTGFLAVSFSFTNTGFEKHQFYGNLFYFPKDTDLHLRECYGDYTKKIKNWSDDKSPNRKITEIKCFFRKLS